MAVAIICYWSFIAEHVCQCTHFRRGNENLVSVAITLQPIVEVALLVDDVVAEGLPLDLDPGHLKPLLNDCLIVD